MTTKKALVTGHDNPDREVNLGIIITPFLDMAFQLLAFFVMIYQPPLFEGQLKGSLLPEEQLLVKGPSKAKPDKQPELSQDVPPHVKDAILVIVRSFSKKAEEGKNADARIKAKKTVEGMPIRIYIKTPETPEPRQVAGEEDTIDEGWQKLTNALKDIRKTLAPLDKDEKNKKRPENVFIKLMPDSGLHYQYVVKTWDICKYAGFGDVGFVAPPDMPKGGDPSMKSMDD
jgi:biopolymer transport protein ExbD